MPLTAVYSSNRIIDALWTATVTLLTTDGSESFVYKYGPMETLARVQTMNDSNLCS